MPQKLSLHRETLNRLSRFDPDEGGPEPAVSQLKCESGAACRPKTTSCQCIRAVPAEA